MSAQVSTQNTTPPTATTSSDFNNDGSVDFSDFLAFAEKFGLLRGEPRYDESFDLDSDGAIGFSDFLQFASEFGK